MKFSVIIPAYNAEKTVAAAVLSAVKDAPPNVEVTVVDDGSTDLTAQKVRELSKKYQNVHLLSKPNGGVSSARNYGMENTDADYILFLDADDTFDEGAVREMTETAAKNGADITMFGYRTVERNAVTDFYPPVEGKISGIGNIYEKIVYPIVFSGINGYIASVWTSVFKKSVITENGLSFDTRVKMSEDTLFMTRLWLCCKDVFCVRKTLLSYTLAVGSATKKYTPDLRDNNRVLNDELQKALSEHGINDGKTAGVRAVAAVISLIVNETRVGNTDGVFTCIKKVRGYCMEYRSDVKKCVPCSRVGKIKKLIAGSPLFGIIFFLVRKIQAKAGVGF